MKRIMENRITEFIESCKSNDGTFEYVDRCEGDAVMVISGRCVGRVNLDGMIKFEIEYDNDNEYTITLYGPRYKKVVSFENKDMASKFVLILIEYLKGEHNKVDS